MNIKKLGICCSLLLSACGGLGANVKAAPEAFGTFTDIRDGKIYNTIEINGQTWLAENTAYSILEHESANGNSENDEKFGLLYRHENAAKSCPIGWRLPAAADYEELLTAVCGEPLEETPPLEGLYYADCRKKLDKMGFNALLAGDFYGGFPVDFKGTGEFWTSNLLKGGFGMAFYLSGPKGFISDLSTDHYASVRCIKETKTQESPK